MILFSIIGRGRQEFLGIDYNFGLIVLRIFPYFSENLRG